MNRIASLLLVFVLGASLVAAGGSQAAAASAAAANAMFEGRVINLSSGWGPAKACDVRSTGVVCFRSEAEMDAAARPSPSLGDSATAAGALPTFAAGTCGTPIKLYDGTSFTGVVVRVSTTGVRTELAPLGFSGRTSSYQIGSCAGALWAGGALYPGSSGAGSSAVSMLAGWDNRVTAVVM